MEVKFGELCPALPKCSVPQHGGRRVHAFARHEDASWNLLNDLSEKGVPMVRQSHY